MTTRRVVLAFGLVTLVLVPVGYAAMYSVFSAYDDEGYFLITLQDYVSGHPVASQAWAIYGPFFYEVVGGLFKLLGIDVGHDAGRAVTLVIWLLASFACGMAVLRLTRNLMLGICAELVAFHLLAALATEPMQPAGLLSLLLIGLVGATSFRGRWPRATSLLIGSIVAAACLVKVNVGIFAVLAVAFAYAAGTTGRWRRVLLPAFSMLLVASPFVLMAGLLNREWVFYFAVVAALSIASIAIACFFTPRTTSIPSALVWLAAGGAVLVFGCLGIAILGGTELNELLNVLVVTPMRVSQLYVWPLRIGWQYVAWAIVSLALGVVILRRDAHGRASHAIPALARIAAGMLTWIGILLIPSSLFFLAFPLAWVATQNPRADSDGVSDSFARVLVPALAVMESLQAYPIAGTQMSIAALLLVPVGAMTINDGISQLRALDARESPRWRLPVASWVAPALFMVTVVFVQLFAFLSVSNYTSTQPLGLHGAALVRVAPESGVAIRSSVTEIKRKCSSFISIPGMASFYLWTEQEAPAGLYLFWMFALDSAQQERIVTDLEGLPRLCVIRNQAVVDFWAEGRPIPNGPLVEYINRSFRLEQRFGDYEVLVRNQ